MATANDEGDLLVLLLDTHMFYSDDLQGGGQSPENLLQQILYFIGAYRLLHDRNHIAVMALHENACHSLFTFLGDEAAADSCNPYKTISEGLNTLLRGVLDQGDPTGPPTAALSGALSRALCLIHRLKNTTGSLNSHVKRSKPRILCLMGSPDVPKQYIPIMNAIFSAQRAEVSIDAVVLHSTDSTFLQQAAHLTGGLYFHPLNRGAVLQLLVQSLSADTHTRRMLSIHQPLGVDFRASCFCHRSSIDVGYVCSVCLSIFCKQASECFICGTDFVSTRADEKKPRLG